VADGGISGQAAENFRGKRVRNEAERFVDVKFRAVRTLAFTAVEGDDAAAFLATVLLRK
jgi:hypothetical protein